MSDVFYPSGVIEEVKVELIDRTLVDEFEDGSTSAKLLWAEKCFKRRYTVKHAPLTADEFAVLQAFFVARNGRYDPFWFRDNVHRGGQAKVRLAVPFPIQRGQSLAYQTELLLEEVAPVRMLVDVDEVTAAAGSAPAYWFDANRQIAYLDGGIYYGESGRYDATSCVIYDRMRGYDGYSVFGDPIQRTTLVSQYGWSNVIGRSNGTVANWTGASKPPGTILLICRHGTVSTDQVLFQVGAASAGNAMGIRYTSGGAYSPWIYGSDAWSGVVVSPVDTWRSVAAVWAASSNAATMYVNGASAAAGSFTRSYVAGPVALGWDGAANMSDLDKSGMGHAMFFTSALSQAQVKAVHNLLRHQYGMAAV
jgi:hypothetical protein